MDQHWPEPIEEERLLATAQHEPLRDHALHGAGASMTGGCSEWGTDGHGFSWMLDNSSQEQVDAFLASPWPQVPMPVHPAPNPLPSTPAAAAAAATPAVPPQWRPPHDIVQAVERAVAEIESGAWDDELFSIKATLPYDKPLQSPPRTSHDYDHSVHYMPCILDAKCNLHYADACHCNNGGCSCHTTVCLPDHRVEPTAYAQVCASHCSNNSNATTYAGHSDATTFAGHVRKGCDDDPGRQEVEPGLTWRRPPPAFFPTTPPAAPTTPTCAKGCCILSVPPAGSERFAAWRAGNGGTPFPLPHKNGAARAGPLIPNTASPPKPRTPSHVTVGAPAARSLSLAPKGIVRPASSGGGVAARPYLAGTTQVAPTLTAMRKLFYVPVEDARRALQLTKNRFAEVCRLHGIRRWPQRQLMGLTKLMESIKSDRGLNEVARKIRLAEVLDNEQAIFEGKETEVRGALQKLSHVYHNRQHLRRNSHRAKEVIVID